MLATEATALLHGREAAEAGGRDRAQDLRGGRARREPADRRDRARRARGRARRADGVRPKTRARRLERRGAAADQGRRPAGQRSDRDRRARRCCGPATSRPKASSSCRSARSGTCCCAPSERLRRQRSVQLSQRAGMRRQGSVGCSPLPAPNSLRRKPGATAESGLTVSVGWRPAPQTRKLTANSPSYLPAAEERPEQRHLREGVVEPVGRNEGAGDIDPVAGVVDAAAEREADLGARRTRRP